MATVKQVPGKKGIWEIRYDSEDPATGNRRQHKRRFQGTKAQADKYAVEIQNQVNKGEYIDLEQISLNEYLGKWLEDYCQPNLSFKGLETYRGFINKYIIPNMGGLKLANLKAGHIQSFYTKMAVSKADGGPGLSNTSILHQHRMLKEALKHAQEWGYIHNNPADKVQPPRRNRPEMKTLSIEQAQYLINSLKDHKIFIPFILALKTGMRVGEVCGLRWENVDLQNGSISITHSLQRQGKSLVLKEPKTKKSRRSIPIPQDVVEVLKTVRRQHKEDRLAIGSAGYDPRGFVCAWDDGKPLEPNWVGKQWRRIRDDDKEQAKKEERAPYISDGVRFHDLRHTHATILLSQGVSLKVVQERLGHESITTTGDIYAHVTPTMQQEAVNVLSRVFNPQIA